MLKDNSKIIIAFISTLFILSSFWLFRVSNNYTNPDYQKNWWALEFSDPKSDRVDFLIENHSGQTTFHYEIFEEDKKITEKDLEIKKGDYKQIVVDQKFEHKKITIRVTSNGEKREIYKNL